MGLALWDLFNIILKLGFRLAFYGAVNGDTENSACTEFAMYLLSFLWKSKKCVHHVQVAMHNSIF